MATPQGTDKLIRFAYQTLTGRYVLACILALLAYEYLITFSKEVNLVWRQKFRLSTLAFFATRYGAGGYVIFDMALKPGIAQLSSICTVLTQSCSCDIWIKFVFAFQLAARAGIVAVFVARTYAICNANRIVLASLGFLAISIMVLDCAQEKDLACYAPSHSATSSFLWAVTYTAFRLAFDLVVVLITIYRTIRVLRLTGKYENLGIIRLILENGLFYFVIVFLSELTVVVFRFAPSSKVVVRNVVDPLPLPLACILVSRFLLALRERANIHAGKSTKSFTHESTAVGFAGAGARVYSFVTQDFEDPLYKSDAKDTYLKNLPDDGIVLGRMAH